MMMLMMESAYIPYGQMRVCKMKCILLTGASGFIGKNIKEALSDRYELYCPSSQELDLKDTDHVEAYLKQHFFDVVLHTANRNDTRNQIPAYEVLNGNLRMFYNLERCNDLYGKMIYLGSGAEYDRSNNIPYITEEYFDTSVPKDAYGLAKYIMAKTCVQKDNIYELCLFGVYGKYEEWERRFISNAICRVLKGMDITLQKNVYFDYLWIDDLVKIIPFFVEKDNLQYKRYNVCRGKKFDLYSLALTVKKILNSECAILVGEPGWKREYTASNCRMLNEMGGFVFTDLESTIASLCEYYKKHISEIDDKKL